MVRVDGFEPPTSRFQAENSNTGLSYTLMLTAANRVTTSSDIPAAMVAKVGIEPT